MAIKYAILGFLSWKPLTGYDLKKIFSSSDFIYWSGNNNQIYKTLVKLHEEGMVSKEVEHQENYPSKKTYTITKKGQGSLKDWLMNMPELPEVKNTFLIQLAWGDQLNSEELDSILERYEEEVLMQLKMRRENIRRGTTSPKRTPREVFLWNMVLENRIMAFEIELNWVRKVRNGLKDY